MPRRFGGPAKMKIEPADLVEKAVKAIESEVRLFPYQWN
jgi:hypothetical protein